MVSSVRFVLSAGYGGGGGGYNRGRDDHRGSYDDRGSGRNDHQSYSDSRGSGGYSRGRNDYPNNQSDSGNGSGGDSSQMETQPDTIFIQNLPRGVTTDELKDLFSQIGIIKVRDHSLFALNVSIKNVCFSPLLERQENRWTEDLDLQGQGHRRRER